MFSWSHTTKQRYGTKTILFEYSKSLKWQFMWALHTFTRTSSHFFFNLHEKLLNQGEKMFNSFNGLEPTCIVQTCHVVLQLQPIRNLVSDSWVYYHCFDLSVIFNRVLQFTDLASEAQFIFLPLSSRSAFEIKAACSEVDWGSYESFVIQRRMYYSRICVCVWERESLTIWPLSAAWAEVLLTVMTSWLTGQLCICTREDQKQKEAGYCDVWPALWEEKKQTLFKLLLDLTTLIIQSIQL